MKQEPELGKPLHSNDLVTAAYLDVPSSGYAAAQPVSTARRALTWKGPEDKPTADSPSAQTRKGKENTSGAPQNWVVVYVLHAAELVPLQGDHDATVLSFYY